MGFWGSFLEKFPFDENRLANYSNFSSFVSFFNKLPPHAAKWHIKKTFCLKLFLPLKKSERGPLKIQENFSLHFNWALLIQSINLKFEGRRLTCKFSLLVCLLCKRLTHVNSLMFYWLRWKKSFVISKKKENCLRDERIYWQFFTSLTALNLIFDQLETLKKYLMMSSLRKFFRT